MSLDYILSGLRHKKDVVYLGDLVISGQFDIEDLVTILKADHHPHQKSVAWVISYIGSISKELLLPYFNLLINLGGRTDLHPAVQRNALKCLTFLSPSDENKIQLLNLCIVIVKDFSQTAAAQAYAIDIILNNFFEADIVDEVYLYANENIDHRPKFMKSKIAKIERLKLRSTKLKKTKD